MRTHLIGSTLLIVLCLNQAIAAENEGPINVVLNVYKVKAEPNGKESLIPGNQSKPGDILEYQATYRNKGTVTIKDLKAIVPIPATGVEYITSAEMPFKPQASLDGKTFDPIPLKKIVILPSGKHELLAVPFADYRFLRWNLGELPAGKSMTVISRMRVTNSASVIAQVEGVAK